MSDEPAQLGVLVAGLIEELPEPPGPRPAAPTPRAPATAHPLVRAALAAFPGSRVVGVRDRLGRRPGLYYEATLTRAMAQAAPDVLFAFGDNLARAGYGGQAAELRGEPNAVGIPTKHAPRRDPDAYFTDADLDAFKAAAGPAFTRLREHAEAGGAIVWPVDGIGTGRAELRQRAPRIWAALERARYKLEEIANRPV